MISGERGHDREKLVRQIKSTMEEQTIGSQQIGEALHTMNDSTQEVKVALNEMSAGNKAIIQKLKILRMQLLL